MVSGGGSPGPVASQVVAVQRHGDGPVTGASDAVAVEAPLEIRVRSGDAPAASLAITMRTPGQDADLAAGFLLTEGIIAAAAELQAIAMLQGADDIAGAGNVIEATLAPGVHLDLDRLQRHFYMTSSCGICGRASLEALKVSTRFVPAADDLCIAAGRLADLPARLAAAQAGFAITGGLHATGLFDADGELRLVREDVGRHNATDKVIGAALRAGGLPLAGRGLVVSGRASFEILQKAVMAGCPLVVAVGAPSSLAVDVAWEFGLTLAGFLRDGRFNVYTGPQRIS